MNVFCFFCLFYLYSGYLFQYKVLVSQEVQIKTLLYSTLHVHVHVFEMYKSIQDTCVHNIHSHSIVLGLKV